MIAAPLLLPVHPSGAVHTVTFQMPCGLCGWRVQHRADGLLECVAWLRCKWLEHHQAAHPEVTS